MPAQEDATFALRNKISFYLAPVVSSDSCLTSRLS
jgi:hypothetical protein